MTHMPGRIQLSVPTTPNTPTADPIERLMTKLSIQYPGCCVVTATAEWWYVTPPAPVEQPDQGWKLHLSVVVDQAAALLEAITAVLIDRHVTWKVCRSLRHLRQLLTAPTPLPQVGKFIAIYPTTTNQAQSLAVLLHERTRHFAGPVIPSDCQYAAESRVFYRYGSFVQRSWYDHETALAVPYIVTPDGCKVRDTRLPGHACPDWAPNPFPLASATHGSKRTGLFGRALRVRGLLQQSVKGGVYVVEHAGKTLVLKEGRFGTHPDTHGRDMRDRLANEYTILTKLTSLGFVPQPVERFTADHNQYILMEHVAGQSLRTLVEQWNYLGIYNDQYIRTIVDQLHALVAQSHRAGVIIRDLTPNNILVSRDQCTLIDLELAYHVDAAQPPFTGYTAGYVPPGHEEADRMDPRYDYYALGAIICYLITGLHPYLSVEVTSTTHLDAILQVFLRDARLIDLAQQARTYLQWDGTPATPAIHVGDVSHTAGAVWDSDQLPFDQATVLEQAILTADALCMTADWHNTTSLWPDDTHYHLCHPACFNSGTTGVAYFLYELAQCTGRIDYLTSARQLVDWTARHHPFLPGETPAGLIFGYAAMPWMMTLLTHAHDDRAYQTPAVDLALQIAQTPTPQLDITHGAAGIGLMLLQVYRTTGIPCLFDQALALAQHIANEAHVAPNGHVTWQYKGQHLWGFAHGAAGLAYYLLAVDTCGGTRHFHNLVTQVGHTLLAHAIPCAADHGRTWLRDATSTTTPWTHWCNGAAGVGDFLLTAAEVLANPAFAHTAHQAAQAISQGHGFGSCCQCHGLAGDGELLVRIQHDYPDHTHAYGITRILQKLAAIRIDTDQGWRWPLEGKYSGSAGYMVGYCGIYSFLLRAFHPPLRRPFFGALADHMHRGRYATNQPIVTS